ncbi:MAG: nucleotide sugar dehydrogenase [Chloroflexi bacterium]|nr:nucleotide sugar dehydrogenase [Chloroflexota bacterium]
MNNELSTQLAEKFNNKTAQISIVGLGYVGLPLAIAFTRVGFPVLGIDVEEERVDLINQGQSYIADINSEALSTAVAANLLKATTTQKCLREVDVICVCLPTPLTHSKEPELSYVIHEAEEISKYLRPGQLVILESTTYPGTTREVVLPILQRSGLEAGADFYLAYAPERVDPGNKKYKIEDIPKIVGGVDAQSAALACLLYQQVFRTVVPVSSAEVAEITKVFENVFRNVNIALVNELAQLCERMRISVWEIIDAASTKPFGFMPFYPGPGIGGHCIPLDPYYLASKAREFDFHTRFIELAAEINEQMPYYVTSHTMEALNRQGKSLSRANILVLGVAYKKDVADDRESPSLKLIKLLRGKAARVDYNDPYIPGIQIEGGDRLSSVELTDSYLSSVDCTIIATAHTCYDLRRIVSLSQLVFDTKGATRGLDGNNITRLGE